MPLLHSMLNCLQSALRLNWDMDQWPLGPNQTFHVSQHNDRESRKWAGGQGRTAGSSYGGSWIHIAPEYRVVFNSSECSSFIVSLIFHNVKAVFASPYLTSHKSMCGKQILFFTIVTATHITALSFGHSLLSESFLQAWRKCLPPMKLFTLSYGHRLVPSPRKW